MAASSSKDQTEAYTLKSKGEINEKLVMMEKTRSLIALSLAGLPNGCSTRIAKVLPEKGLLALEINGEKQVNEKLLAATRIGCSSQVNGIECHFELGKLKEATLHGQNLFAAEFPASLFWQQRRRFYRVPIPYSAVLKCKVTLPNEEVQEFEVLNLSVLGLALLDKSGQLRTWGRIGQTFRRCKLYTAGLEDEEFSLEIRNKVETTRSNDRNHAVRVGFAFQDTTRSFEVKIQKLMYEMERELRQERVLVKD
jgi:c-di-GMP-binding flagellar brake protein YcgR